MGDLAFIVCTSCQTTEWWSRHGWIPAAEGIRALFGDFELTGALPGVGAPASLVLTYRPPSRDHRSRMTMFPIREWVQIDESLWLSHDGETLLLAPTDRSVASNFAG